MVLNSSLHFIFYVLDSIFEFHNATLLFHDTKFEFLFSNASSHFISSVHDPTLEFHNATFVFEISVAPQSRCTFSFNECHPLRVCASSKGNPLLLSGRKSIWRKLYQSQPGINGLSKQKRSTCSF